MQRLPAMTRVIEKKKFFRPCIFNNIILSQWFLFSIFCGAAVHTMSLNFSTFGFHLMSATENGHKNH